MGEIMKYMYQSILVCAFLITIAPMCGLKYTFHNKTDVNLHVTYFYKMDKTGIADGNYIRLFPGEEKTVDTGKWCMADKIIVRDMFDRKYPVLEDTGGLRCYSKKWDIVVKKGKLDLVNHKK